MNLAVTLIVVALVVYIVWLERRIKAIKLQLWNGISLVSKAGQDTLKALDMTDCRVSILEGKLKAIPENAIPEEVFAQMISQFRKADALQNNQ